MPSSIPKATPATEDNPVVTSCRLGARDALRATVAAGGISQKALAIDVCDGDEPMFSKKLAGVPGRPFDLNDLDRLPRVIQVAWLQRMCAAIGLTVPRELELSEVTEQLLMRVDELASLARLARVVTKPLKARL